MNPFKTLFIFNIRHFKVRHILAALFLFVMLTALTIKTMASHSSLTDAVVYHFGIFSATHYGYLLIIKLLMPHLIFMYFVEKYVTGNVIGNSAYLLLRIRNLKMWVLSHITVLLTVTILYYSLYNVTSWLIIRCFFHTNKLTLSFLNEELGQGKPINLIPLFFSVLMLQIFGAVALSLLQTVIHFLIKAPNIAYITICILFLINVSVGHVNIWLGSFFTLGKYPLLTGPFSESTFYLFFLVQLAVSTLCSFVIYWKIRRLY
ncbi:hypothetical protein [Paenibacillus physcomitrellae]|uniref:hypothetical protein n=1 Tax=Paenibacillus physcomitrellae TaxID=1619311 RepID=UPI000B8CD06A|nr:hypothetical protein [Paenibacillus physcomitrellae]